MFGLSLTDFGVNCVSEVGECGDGLGITSDSDNDLQAALQGVRTF
jgi:hypothetical protein